MLHVRDHDRSRVRIWTPEMDAYGQFNVVPLTDVETLKQTLDKLTLTEITVHRCEGHDDCKCRPLTFGETVADAL